MVQGKTKLAGQASVTGKSRPKGEAMTKRKAAPVIVRHRDRTSAAINRRNEQLMAGRLAHEGGTLAIIPKPAAVTHYDSGRAATSVKQHKQLQQSNVARHARMKREGLAVGERGKRDKKEVGVGEKRKRGLDGVHKVGDEWFDERDRELEALVYESEDSDDEGETKEDEDEQGDDDDEDDEDEVEDERQEDEDTAKPEEERKEAEAVTTTAAGSDTKAATIVNGAQAGKGKKPAVKGQTAAVVRVDEDVDGSARATKRAKALLGGWFAQRDSKR